MEPEKLHFELPTDKWDIKLPKNSPQNYEVEADFYKWTKRLVVVIIVWKWWTTQWYQNKYETIAKNLVKNHWANVFVIENPWISWDNPELFFDCTMKFVKKKVKDNYNSVRQRYRLSIQSPINSNQESSFEGTWMSRSPIFEWMMTGNIFRITWEIFIWVYPCKMSILRWRV